MSKHTWIAELQGANGNAIEYHSIEIDPKHYESRLDYNSAHRSWYWFMQRERKNHIANRGPRSKVSWCTYWMQPDDVWYVMSGSPLTAHHKTIWDLYKAIGYDYKTKRYNR